jgi:hypothetical protein
MILPLLAAKGRARRALRRIALNKLTPLAFAAGWRGKGD